LLGLGGVGSLAVLPAFFVNADFDAGMKILEKAGPVLVVNNIIGTFIVGLFVVWGNRWQKISKSLEVEQAKNSRLAQIAQKTTNGIVVTDEFGTTEWVNQSFVEMTGYRLDEVIGRRLGDILQGPDSDPDIVEEMRQKIKQRKGFNVTLVNYHKNGQAFSVHIDCQTFNETDGSLKFLAVQNDVTEQAQILKNCGKARAGLKILLRRHQIGYGKWMRMQE